MWTAPLEGEPQPRKPHPLGEPLYHPSLPEPSPTREGCDLWGGIEAPSQRAHAARGPASPWASAGGCPLLPETRTKLLVPVAVKGQRGIPHHLPSEGVSCHVPQNRGPCFHSGHSVCVCVCMCTHALSLSLSHTHTHTHTHTHKWLRSLIQRQLLSWEHFTCGIVKPENSWRIKSPN